MTPVTDPSILAELNGSSEQGGNLRPVTDPSVLAELNGNGRSAPIQQLADSPLIQGILGAGDALNSTLSAGLVNPHTGSGNAYNVGKFGGNVAGFLGGGELLDAARAGAEILPHVGQIAKFLGGQGLAGVARRGLGSAAYGAATNPEDRGLGAAEGAGFSAAADAIPGTAGLLAKGANFFRPQKYMKSILDELGMGKGLEENNQSLAEDVKKAYEQKVGEGSAMYKPVFDSVGNNKIYRGRWQENPNSSYGSLNPDLFNTYSGDLRDVHYKFGKNPTLQNAHDLQGQLGSSIRGLESKELKSGLTPAERGDLQGYQKSQSALRTDMDNFLASKDPKLAQQYKDATSNWAQNVIPYIDNPKISKIAKGEIQNPRNVANIFRNPEGGMQKISEDMGPLAARKILFSELGKYGPSSTPEKLLENYKKLEEKGLGSYVSPKMADLMDALAARVKARNTAQIVGGGATGALLGGHLASGIPLAEGLGTGIGALLGYGAGKLPPMSGGAPLSKFLMNSVRGAYRPLSQAVLANTIPGGPNGN